MLEKWKDAISNDPFFNPNLGPDTYNTQFAFPPQRLYEWHKEKIPGNKQHNENVVQPLGM